MQANAERDPKGDEERGPRSVEIARKGITNASQFSGLMSALISDVLEGRMSSQTCNAAVNAGGKLLKVVEMQIRYGKPVGEHGEKELILCPPERDALLTEKIAKMEIDLAAIRAGVDVKR